MAKKTGKSAAKTKAVTRSSRAVSKKPSASKKAVRQPRRLKEKPVKGLARLKRKKQGKKLPSSWRFFRQSWTLVWQHRRIFFGISLVYAIVNFVMVRGSGANVDVPALRSVFDQYFGGHANPLVSSTGVLTSLISSADSTSGAAATAYQTFLVIIVSLAVIWSLRQTLAGYKVSLKAAFYKSTTPLIPFALVLLIIGVQLLPFVIATTLFSMVLAYGIAITILEKLVFGAIFGIVALGTLYILSSSLFATYIVTLPDMTPLKALRSAKRLCRGRRWLLIRKIVFLPFWLLFFATVIMLPIILIASRLAQPIFILLVALAPVMLHAYMYTLYRELLNEET